MSLDPRFTLIGLIIGFLIGLSGMGGGALLTPVMILVMGVKPIIAVGTDLAYGTVTRIVGGAEHLRHGTVHRRAGYLLAAGSVPATILGVGLTSAIKRLDPSFVNVFLLHSIAYVLIFAGVLLLVKPFLVALVRRRARQSMDPRDRITELGDRKPWLLPIIGAVVGFMVGLTSVGSGTLIIVFLMFLYPRWQSKELVGTDVFHAAMLGAGASIAQFAAGNINVPMMTALLIGSIPGVLLGSRLAAGFPENLLRLSLASILLLSGAKLV